MKTSELSPETADQTQTSAIEAKKDMALVQRFLAGDESAFTAIMDRHRSKIFHTALRHLHSHSDAEEVTQDTFVRAYRGFTRFRGDCSVATWLYRIATNLARNRYWYLFRRRRHATLSLDCTFSDDNSASLGDLIASDTPDPAQESTRAEFAGLVDECIAMLEAPHREILALWNVQHLPYDEIAAKLHIRVGTVKSRMARARRTLRAFINARCPSFAEAATPDDYFLSSNSHGQASLVAA